MPDRTQVEGPRGGDKGREVNPGKQYKERRGWCGE